MRMFSSSILVAALSLLPIRAIAEDTPASRPISLTMRSASLIEPADAQAIAAHASAVAKAAAFYGYNLDSSWSYEQAVCPLAPRHIVLNYRSAGSNAGTNPGSGAPVVRASSFSALVPRQGGVVRIVPLVRGGTEPFLAPWGEHSYAVFNAMTAGNGGLRRENIDLSSGDAYVWGLCYVALVGEQGMVGRPDGELNVFGATEPTIRVGTAGEIGLAFTVQDDALNYSVWELAFSPKGALLHADREQHTLREVGMDSAMGVVPAGQSAGLGTGASIPPVQGSIATPKTDADAAGAAAGATVPAAPARDAAVAAQRGRKTKPEWRPVPDGPIPVGKPIPPG